MCKTPGVGVTGICEPPNVNAENPPKDLYNSSKRS